MTFVYPLGSGSKHDNLELKISLRSIEQHCTVGDVFVIGERPHWLSSDAHHIPFPDHSKHNKDGNMIQKILQVCRYDWVSPFFVRMSDDQVVLSDYPDFTPYYYGKLENAAEENDGDWGKRAKVTVELLREKGMPTWNYDTHAPVIVWKEGFKNIMDGIDQYFAFFDRGYVINSLYYNHHFDKTGLPTFPKPHKHVLRLLDADFVDPEGFTFLNYNDYGFTPKLQKWLLNRFPKPSIFEK